MGSSKESKIRKIIRTLCPWLFTKCIGANYHWIWERLCWCCLNEHTYDFHGGIYDLKTKQEYQPCQQCEEELEPSSVTMILNNKKDWL